MPCDLKIWLGIMYNASIKAYTWLDGWPLTFNHIPSDTVVQENISFYDNGAGSNEWTKTSISTPLMTSCQLRLGISERFERVFLTFLYEGNYVPTKPLQYPTSMKIVFTL